MAERNFEIIQNGISGNISVNNDNGISVDMNIRLDEPLPDTDVIKLNLISSTCPNSPINCGTAQMDGNVFRLIKTFSIFQNVDKAEIIRKNAYTENSTVLATVCFTEQPKVDNIEYEIQLDEVQSKLLYLEQNPAYKSYLLEADELKSPLENAADALENLRLTLSAGNIDNAPEKIMNTIRESANEYEPVTDGLPFEFVWYKITSLKPIAEVSSFYHIINTDSVIDCFLKYGHYLLGIKKDDDVICFAIPADIGAPTPISHIDDCTVYVRPPDSPFEYCTVCVSFEPDGQYFTMICE